MDQHPIPQNVTGFQFKLIGAMTVKQFGYVAVGVIAAVITYYLPIKGAVAVLLKAILIPLFGASGAVAAFVPIDGRPIDVMAGNFIKALLSPNQYVYHKTIKQFSFSKISTPKPSGVARPAAKHMGTPQQQMVQDRGRELQKLLIKSSEKKINNSIDAKEADFLKTFLTIPMGQPTQPAFKAVQAPIAALPAKPAQPTQPVAPVAQPAQPSPGTPDAGDLAKKEEELKKELANALQAESSQKTTAELATAHQTAMELQKQVEEIHSQKTKLEQEILKLKLQLSNQKTSITAVAQPVQPAAPAQDTSSHVHSVPKEMNKRLGILVSDTPNIVSGMVKDSRGNVLPNILVEIKDKNGNPVRAFKTNMLGNFASATPLASGTYTITLEDLKKIHTFDSIQITANDQIMLPIEIISYDKREELRKDLFS